MGDSNGRSEMLGVWSIIEKEGQDKNFWHRVGTAFVNRDGSLNVYLNSLPVNGKLHIRPIKEWDNDKGGGGGGGYQGGGDRGGGYQQPKQDDGYKGGQHDDPQPGDDYPF